MKTPTILKASKRRCKKDLGCRSCDICSPNSHIVTGRDEVGQGQDNNDGEEGGERERQLSHPEQLLQLPPQQILQMKLCFLKDLSSAKET